MKDSLISIVVPVYNAGRFLSATIESALGQTWRKLELILVNDGSTDDSQRIIDEYKAKDPRIISITTENMGAPHARNTGLDAASGEYILFFDADDVMLPREAELLLAGMEEGTDLVIGSRDKITEDGKRFQSDTLKPGLYDPRGKDIDYLIHISPFPNNKLYSARLLREKDVRFRDVKIAQDANLYLKYLAVCGKVRTIADTVCLYRVVDNSISRTYSRKVIDILRCEEDIEEFAGRNGANETYLQAMNGVFVKFCLGQIMKIGFMKDRATREEVLDTVGNSILDRAKEKDIRDPRALRSIERIRQMLRHRKWYTSDAYCLCRRISSGLRQRAIRAAVRLRAVKSAH